MGAVAGRGVAYCRGVVAVRVLEGELPQPIETLERHFRDGGVTLIRAVFENTFFATPESVRDRCPYFPEFARKSRDHYPSLDKGGLGEWQGRQVKLDDNRRAQMAWAKYSGRPIARRSGYGVRHVWGHPWDPDAFTAGWNLAYMPFWAGMLTEDQHPHEGVQVAIKQASWRHAQLTQVQRHHRGDGRHGLGYTHEAPRRTQARELTRSSDSVGSRRLHRLGSISSSALSGPDRDRTRCRNLSNVPGGGTARGTRDRRRAAQCEIESIATVIASISTSSWSGATSTP